MDRLDVSLVDAGGDVDVVHVVGDGERGAGGDERAWHAVVDCHGAIGRGPDAHERLGEPVLDLDATDDLALIVRSRALIDASSRSRVPVVGALI